MENVIGLLSSITTGKLLEIPFASSFIDGFPNKKGKDGPKRLRLNWLTLNHSPEVFLLNSRLGLREEGQA